MFGIEMFEIERCKIKPKGKNSPQAPEARLGYAEPWGGCAPPPPLATNLPPTRTGKLSRPTNETFAKFRVFRE